MLGCPFQTNGCRLFCWDSWLTAGQDKPLWQKDFPNADFEDGSSPQPLQPAGEHQKPKKKIPLKEETKPLSHNSSIQWKLWLEPPLCPWSVPGPNVAFLEGTFTSDVGNSLVLLDLKSGAQSGAFHLPQFDNSWSVDQSTFGHALFLEVSDLQSLWCCRNGAK